METSIRIGKYIFSVGSDDELNAFIDAAERLKIEREKQKIERDRAAAEIICLIDQFVADYGRMSICNDAGEIFIDASNVAAVGVGWNTEDD